MVLLGFCHPRVAVVLLLLDLVIESVDIGNELLVSHDCWKCVVWLEYRVGGCVGRREQRGDGRQCVLCVLEQELWVLGTQEDIKLAIFPVLRTALLPWPLKEVS